MFSAGLYKINFIKNKLLLILFVWCDFVPIMDQGRMERWDSVKNPFPGLFKVFARPQRPRLKLKIIFTSTKKKYSKIIFTLTKKKYSNINKGWKIHTGARPVERHILKSKIPVGYVDCCFCLPICFLVGFGQAESLTNYIYDWKWKKDIMGVCRKGLSGLIKRLQCVVFMLMKLRMDNLH